MMEDPNSPSALAARKSPEEIEQNVERARSLIREDIKELQNKLKPEHLKGAAKDAWQSAKEHTVDALSGRVSDARQKTVSAVTANGAPLMLIGLGVGWLAMSVKQRREHERWYSPDGPRLLGQGRESTASAYDETRALRTEERNEPETFFGERALARAERHEPGESRIQHLRHLDAHQIADAGREKLRQVRGRVNQVQTKTREVASSNPLAMGAVALAAGIGIGLLLPTTRTENRLMGGTRDRLLGQARDLTRQGRSAAAHISDTTRSAAAEMKDVLSQRINPVH